MTDGRTGVAGQSANRVADASPRSPIEHGRCSELALRAMGCRARIVAVDAPTGVVEEAARRLWELERRWSRFLAGSEVRRAEGGRPAIVSDDTYLLFERAIDAWCITEGRFDPTVADAIAAAGYDRSFEEVTSPTATRPGSPAYGCAAFELDPVLRAVTMPAGVGFDPGAIGKGLAADVVTSEMLASGARGALVEIGGDVRVSGCSPHGGAWRIAIEDAFGGARPLFTARLMNGAVATSSRMFHAWERGDGSAAHHVIDPRTGAPVESGVAATTVVASAGWVAEAFATATFVAGQRSGIEVLRAHRLAGVVVDLDGVVRSVGMELYA